MLFSRVTKFSVNDDRMQFGTMTFLRTRPGFIGLGTENGKPVILLPGMHLSNSPNFEFQRSVSVNDAVITNGPLNIIRVSPGQIGLATVNGRPIVLESGVHFTDEAAPHQHFPMLFSVYPQSSCSFACAAC